MTRVPFSAYQGDEPYVFVSYAHADADQVYPELIWLRDQGINVWYDEGISPGRRWSEDLASALSGASLMLLYVTPNAVDSPNCLDEVNFALDAGMRTLSVFLEDTEFTPGLKLRLGALQAVLRSAHSEQDFRSKVLAAIGDALPEDALAAESDPPDTNPEVATTSESLTPSIAGRRNKALWLTVPLVLVAAGMIGWWWPAPDQAVMPTPASIAVLPFESLTADPDNLAAGLHEDVLSELSILGDLVVISRTSVMQFQGNGTSMPVIAEQLKVTHVLAGSTRRSADRIRVSVQLIEAATDKHIWAETFEQNLDDVFRVQSDIARSVANQLAIKFTADEIDRIGDVPTENLEAYLLYKQAARDGFSPLPWEPERLAQLERAIQLDPGFADAHRALSLGYRTGLNWGEVRERSLHHAREALRLSPDNAAVQWNMAQVLRADGQDGVETHLLRAIALNPNNVLYLNDLGQHYLYTGRSLEALKVFERVQRREPLQTNTWLLTLRLMLYGERQGLRAHADSMMKRPDGGIGAHMVAPYYSALGDHYGELIALKRAQGLYNPAYGQINSPEHMVPALLALGELDAAERWLDWMAETQPPVLLMELWVDLYVARGDPDALAAYFDEVRGELPPALSFAIDEPALALLRLRTTPDPDLSILRERVREAQAQRIQAWEAAGSPVAMTPNDYLKGAVYNGPYTTDTDILPGLRDYYENGGLSWYIDHKYIHLALIHALNGDTRAALEAFRTAADYGFNELYRLDALNVLNDVDRAFHGLGDHPEFLALVEDIRRSNTDVSARIRESAPGVLDPRL